MIDGDFGSASVASQRPSGASAAAAGDRLAASRSKADQQRSVRDIAGTSRLSIVVGQIDAERTRLAPDHGAVGLRQVVDRGGVVFLVGEIAAPQRHLEAATRAGADIPGAEPRSTAARVRTGWYVSVSDRCSRSHLKKKQ